MLLGGLNGLAQARWLKSLEVFNEQGEVEQLKLFPRHLEFRRGSAGGSRLGESIRLERIRQFGGCFLGWELWKRLGLDQFLSRRWTREQPIPWSRVAAVLAINRLCAPGSELAIEERWSFSTALDLLLEIEEGKINDTRLYRCLDRILPHKGKLEQHLDSAMGSYSEQSRSAVLRPDQHLRGRRGGEERNDGPGYSRDHRPDCEQMVIALIVKREEFPFSYETFDGNRADVSTMESILRMVERNTARHGASR